MIYDLEIAVPVTIQDKYRQRLIDFKTLGIQNVSKTKLIIKLLAGNETLSEELISGWPCDIVVVQSNYQTHVGKICDYYANLSPDDLKHCRWFAKFDDDSITDIDGLVNNLDADYDHARDYHIVTALKGDLYREEIEVIRRLGYSRWLNLPKKAIFHEHEGSVLSQSAITRIACSDAVKALTERAKMPKGVCDQILGVAAKIAKIPTVDAWFLCVHPLVTHFSLLGGSFNHIHFIAHDINPDLFNIIKRIDERSVEEKTLENMDFGLYQEGDPLGIIRLLPAGCIGVYHNRDKRFWKIDNGDLHLLNDMGQTTTVFTDFLNNLKSCEGTYTPDSSIKHTIKRID